MVRRILLLLVPVFLFGSCQNTTVPDKPIVMVSIRPLRYFVESIADSTLEVGLMVPPGSSPELYEPSPKQQIALSQSAVYFAIGLLEFEKNLKRKFEGSYSGRYVDLSEGAHLLEGARCNHTNSLKTDMHRHSPDPHIWMSVSEGKRMAKRILDVLIEEFPNNKERYRANYVRLAAELNRVDSTIRSILSHSRHKAFLIYHPALGYFAHDYGLTQLSIEQGGKKPSIKGVAEVTTQCRQLGVNTVLVQSQFDTHNAESIAHMLNGKVIQVDPLSPDWANNMVRIARIIANEKDE